MPDSEPPVPKHLRRTKQVIDFVKYVVITVGSIFILGWVGHEYIGQFQTEEEAAVAQAATTASITKLTEGVHHNEQHIDALQIYSVRIELEQRNTTDRLHQLLILQQATTRQEIRQAQDEIDELQEDIDQRDDIIRDPRRLQALADRVERRPLDGLNGHL